MTRLITLEAWIARTYAPETAPAIGVVRRWARQGKIAPVPVKHGRAYYVEEGARYTPAPEPSDLIGRLRRDYAHATPAVTH